jgi:hypothetical protein
VLRWLRLRSSLPLPGICDPARMFPAHWRLTGLARRIKALRWSILAVYALLLSIYQVFMQGQTSTKLGNFVALCVLIAVAAALALAGLGLDRLRGRRLSVEEPTHFLVGGAGHAEAAEELSRAKNNRLWWHPSTVADKNWIENLFVFWASKEGLDAGRIRLEVEYPLTMEAFEGVFLDDPELVPKQPERKKAALGWMSAFVTDDDAVLHCHAIDWEFARWAETNYDAFYAANRSAHGGLSVFGVAGWTPFPAITCVHTVVETSDGWIVFSLRNLASVAYYPEQWSVSFEEQVEIGGKPGPDATIHDTIARGLREEFGVVAPEVAATCLAVTREFGKLPPTTVTHDRATRVLATAVVATALLPLTLDEFWPLLHRRWLRPPDQHENTAWMACRFQSWEDVEALLRHAPTGTLLSPSYIRNRWLGFEVTEPPFAEPLEGGFTWHGTSRARLYLWGQHARTIGRI